MYICLNNETLRKYCEDLCEKIIKVEYVYEDKAKEEEPKSTSNKKAIIVNRSSNVSNSSQKINKNGEK